MRAMSPTCWKSLLESGEVFAETCVAGIVFGRRWPWVVKDGERALLFRKILRDGARPWGSATLVHVPNPAREELCAIFCDGLEGMLDGDDNWSNIAQCTHRLLLGAVPKGDNPTSELRTRLRLCELAVLRNFSRDGSNKDGACRVSTWSHRRSSH